jgi:hypothetical protein
MAKGKVPKLDRNKPETNRVPQIDKRMKYADYLSFSFIHLNLDHSQYNVEGKDDKYFLKLIARFSDLCSMPAEELHASKSKSLRFHPFDWEQATEKCFGIPDEDQIVDKPMEFSISANKYGRVMGFCVGNIFYIVWFDPEHRLIPGKKR